MHHKIFIETCKDIIEHYKNLEAPIKDAIKPLIQALFEDNLTEDEADAAIDTIYEALYGRENSNIEWLDDEDIDMEDLEDIIFGEDDE